MSPSSRLQIAVIGFGPKGFGCLERLAIECHRRERIGLAEPLSVRLTVHDPNPHPGAGPIYAPDQPAEMLLNFRARHVDLWSEDNDLIAQQDRLNFSGWLDRHHPGWGGVDTFVPRQLMGRYLEDSYRILKAALPETLQLHHVPRMVIDLVRKPEGWSIHHTDPEWDLHGVDEVMISVGHGTWSETSDFDSWSEALPKSPRTRRISGVYPVQRMLADTEVPPGSTVGMRGFALTWIDATLALHAGRTDDGGGFPGDGSEPTGDRGEPTDDGVTPAGFGRTDEGPRTIVPFSRSGLPMLAKPGAELDRRSMDLSDEWEALRRSILEARTRTPADLLARLEAGATRALAAIRSWPLNCAATHMQDAMTTAFSLAKTPNEDPRIQDPLRLMRDSVRVALGQDPPDGAWALGESWRQAYPAITVCAGHGGLASTFPQEFRRLAQAMERYAFGPPAMSLSRILSLATAGYIDLRFVRSPGIVARSGRLALQSAGATIPLDILVNAVVSRPGVHLDTPLLLRMVDRGYLRLCPGSDGIMVTPSAACVRLGAPPLPGLSAVGRATEGWVVGNDTLSRTLHSHAHKWARRILGHETAIAGRRESQVATGEGSA